MVTNDVIPYGLVQSPRGDLDGLSRPLQRKEALIDELNLIDSLTRETLNPLHSKVERNQALLDGALQGIRLVASRMAALRRDHGPVETYTQSGGKTTLDGVKASSLEKRA